MFGLMRGRGEQRRLHYCGTCKTIGQTYGHAARLLLNHDAVFLAELLTHLAGGASGTSFWEPAYQQRACWAAPRELPEVLRYAAAVTVFLADAKLADHVADARYARGWQWARRLLDRRVRRAEQELRGWAVPVAEIRDLLATQSAREQQTDADWAHPTAAVTGLIFQQGAMLIGRQDLIESLGHAGERFGRLVYLLDAWDDYDRDRSTGAFNALAAGYGERRRSVVQTAGADVEHALRTLGCEQFALRLHQNIAARLGLSLPVLQHQCGVSPRPVTIAVVGHSGITLFADEVPSSTEPVGSVEKPKQASRCSGCGCDNSACSGCCEALSFLECCCDCGQCCECL